MIRSAVYNLSLTKAEFKQLSAIKTWSGSHWDTPPNNNISTIKDKIRQQLEATQSVCCYCGLKLKTTSNGEIEHVAPKSKHPEFTFTLKNLALACHYCNFSEKKGQKETIVTGRKHKTYSKCEFLLVHPYFDDPNLHYEWTDNAVEILIQVRNNSAKGLFSITMFGLDTPQMNEARAAQVRIEELKAAKPLSVADEQLLNDTLNYKE